MDDKTSLALTLILSFIIGVMLGVGGRLAAESSGRETKIGNSDAIDLMLLVFSIIAFGYMLAIVWQVKLFSVVFAVIAASVYAGSSCGSKIAPRRNQTFNRFFLVGSGIGIPLLFHLVLP